jgi:hypothetical protein
MPLAQVTPAYYSDPEKEIQPCRTIILLRHDVWKRPGEGFLLLASNIHILSVI